MCSLNVFYKNRKGSFTGPDQREHYVFLNVLYESRHGDNTRI